MKMWNSQLLLYHACPNVACSHLDNNGLSLSTYLGNVLTSSNVKADNDKTENSDSGAESEEEEAKEKLQGAEQSSSDDKKMMKKSTDKNLEIIVTNGYKDGFAQDIYSAIHTDSSQSTRSIEDENPVDQSLQQTGNTVVCVHQDTNEDPNEDALGIDHLTSDSDSEEYCMEHFGQEGYYLGGDLIHQHFGKFCEDAQLSPGNGSIGKMQMVAVKRKGEVKHRGEDGRSSSGAPHC